MFDLNLQHEEIGQEIEFDFLVVLWLHPNGHTR